MAASTEAVAPHKDAPDRARDEQDTPPPFLGTWRNVYLFVIGELFATAGLFYLLTRWAS